MKIIVELKKLEIMNQEWKEIAEKKWSKFLKESYSNNPKSHFFHELYEKIMGSFEQSEGGWALEKDEGKEEVLTLLKANITSLDIKEVISRTGSNKTYRINRLIISVNIGDYVGTISIAWNSGQMFRGTSRQILQKNDGNRSFERETVRMEISQKIFEILSLEKNNFFDDISEMMGIPITEKREEIMDPPMNGSIPWWTHKTESREDAQTANSKPCFTLIWQKGSHLDEKSSAVEEKYLHTFEGSELEYLKGTPLQAVVERVESPVDAFVWMLENEYYKNAEDLLKIVGISNISCSNVTVKKDRNTQLFTLLNGAKEIQVWINRPFHELSVWMKPKDTAPEFILFFQQVFSNGIKKDENDWVVYWWYFGDVVGKEYDFGEILNNHSISIPAETYSQNSEKERNGNNSCCCS
ncbi:hypothetical protein HN393_01025 [bacterium]|nr:hypothetical protein [bacterium]MBT7772414.1 hypothetical protein [bacterium]